MRQVHTVWDATSAAAGNINTGNIDVSCFSELTIYFRAAGAAAPALCACDIISDAGSTVHRDAVTLAIGGDGQISYGAAQNPGSAALTNSGPVPARIFVQATGGAGSTVRVYIEGVYKPEHVEF